MTKVYWDTMLFIYWFEDDSRHAPRIREIFEKMQGRRDILCTSIFTGGEILMGPYKQGADELAKTISEYFAGPEIELLPFTREAAERYAKIRSSYSVSPADAIHLASAAESGVDLFLTNDRRLHRLVIPGIQFVAGLEVNIF
jgi:predicted nucleic acid-binding protein